MAIKAHGISTRIDTEAGTVTFSMLGRTGVALVEHTVPIEGALGILSFILAVMDDEDLFDEIDEETEVVGHC